MISRLRGLWPCLTVLAGVCLLWRPALAQDGHAPAEHAPAADHGQPAHGEGHGEGEAVSELAVEHGSWFKPLSDAVNRAVGRPLLSGYILVAWTVIALLVIGAAVATKDIRAGSPEAHDPKGLQNLFEYVVEGLYSFTEGIIGPGGSKYAPLVATFFLYILFNNYIAIVPGFVAPTSTLNMTLALGITAFLSVQYFAIRQNGLGGWLKHFAGNPSDIIGWLLSPLMFVLELIGECVKPLSLSMRLFGNIFGEDTVVIQLALFALGLGGWKIVHGHVVEQGQMWAAFVPLQLPMMAFALFGGLIQALVFSMLTCIYISLLTSHEGHEHEHDHGAEAAHH